MPVRILLVDTDPAGGFSLRPDPLPPESRLIAPGTSARISSCCQGGPYVFARLRLGPPAGISTIGPGGIAPIGSVGPSWDASAWRVDEVTIDDEIVDHRQVNCGFGSIVVMTVTNVGAAPAHFYASWECHDVQ